ncbi:DUF4158 domain-containing protein [Aquimarina macrocephali]|uniref:DUF4158 domain-containing protein n=1 Tax=Aquimarina macrocephali TaxID=666563 RepID=UPI0004AC6D0E|nr:DUF4158 domain-containing protein [Aquimarina macrocephali]
MHEDPLSLSQAEDDWIRSHSDHNIIGAASLLLYFKKKGSFPRNVSDVTEDVINFIACVYGSNKALLKDYSFSGRSYRRHCDEIRILLGVRRLTEADIRNAEAHLISVSLSDADHCDLEEQLRSWLREEKIEIPAASRLKVIISAAREAGNTTLFRELHSRLTEESRVELHALIYTSEDTLSFIKSDPGRASLETVLSEIEKLQIVRDLCLPENLTANISSSRLQPLYLRAGTESTWDFKRHPEHISLSLLALLCLKRRGEIIDALGDLIIQLVHKIKKGKQ